MIKVKRKWPYDVPKVEVGHPHDVTDCIWKLALVHDLGNLCLDFLQRNLIEGGPFNLKRHLLVFFLSSIPSSFSPEN